MLVICAPILLNHSVCFTLLTLLNTSSVCILVQFQMYSYGVKNAVIFEGCWFDSLALTGGVSTPDRYKLVTGEAGMYVYVAHHHCQHALEQGTELSNSDL